MKALNERYEREINAHHAHRDALESYQEAMRTGEGVDQALADLQAASSEVRAAREMPEGFICIPCKTQCEIGAQVVLVLKAAIFDYQDGREPVRLHFNPKGPEVYVSICVSCSDEWGLQELLQSLRAPRLEAPGRTD